MSRDPFLLLAEGQGEVKSTVKRTLAEHTGGILLAVCLVLTAALPLVALRLVNPFSPDFFLRTAYSILTSTLAYILFIPEGRRIARERDPYTGVLASRLTALSRLVEEGRLALFSRFCLTLCEEECEERRVALIARAELFPEGRTRRRLLARAERLLPRRIYPSLILTGGGGGEMSDVGRPRLSYGLRGALLRPLPVLATAILFSSVSILPAATPDAATAIEILSGLFGVTMAAFAGFTAGRAQAAFERTRCEGRILLLTAFLEREGIAPPAKA